MQRDETDVSFENYYDDDAMAYNLLYQGRVPFPHPIGSSYNGVLYREKISLLRFQVMHLFCFSMCSNIGEYVVLRDNINDLRFMGLVCGDR